MIQQKYNSHSWLKAKRLSVPIKRTALTKKEAEGIIVCAGEARKGMSTMAIRINKKEAEK